jgi:hypothetical protein
VLAKSSQVSGEVRAANYASPTPGNLGTAVGAKTSAYNDAINRAATYSEEGGGEIGGLTLQPGVHKFSTGVRISNTVVLNGSCTDVFIFSIA